MGLFLTAVTETTTIKPAVPYMRLSLCPFSILIVLLALGPASYAQAPLSIKGRVVTSGKALEFANVYLYRKPDSAKVEGFCTADSTGGFILSGLRPGEYWLKAQRIGFLPLRKEIALKGDIMTIDLGDLNLRPDARTLQDVTITAPRKMIQKTPQGFVVLAEANLTAGAGTATDLLQNTPTVLVDEEGGITLRGKSPQILINGRNSALTAKGLDRIPASSIDRIEIINNPGAKYDAEAEGGIINIILKKNTRQGTNGAFALGGGYGAKYRLNSSFLINHQVNGKLNLGLTYDNRFAGRKRWIEAQRENFHLDSDHYLIQHRNDDRQETTHNLKFNADYAIDKNNDLGFEGIWSHDGQHNFESLTSRLENAAHGFTSANNRYSDENERGNEYEAALNYEHRFRKEGAKLDILLSNSIVRDRQNTMITTRSLDAQGDHFGDPFLQRTSNYGDGSITTVKIDQALPVSAHNAVEFGYKGLFRHLWNDYKSLYEQGGGFVPDPRASNIFTYDDRVNSGYASFKGYTGQKVSPRLRYEGGIRLEQNRYGGSSSGAAEFSKSYLNAFPNVLLAYGAGKDAFVKFSYGKRINRPDLGDLNPFTDITDSLNPHTGNPDLVPEIVHAIELGYNKDWSKFQLVANLFYRKGKNTIMNYVFVDSVGHALSKPVNIGTSETYGVESIIGAQLGSIWQFNASLSMYQQNLKGAIEGKEINSNAFTWYAKTAQTFSFWKGGRIQVIANYQAPLAVTQGKRIAVYSVDLGFQQRIMNNKGRIGVSVTDLFYTKRNGNNLYTPDFTSWRRSWVDSRAVVVTFGYTFGTKFKENLMENKYSND